MERQSSPTNVADAVEIILITPEMATKWLAIANIDNRSVRDKRVDQYARDMSEGRWHLTNQGIGFSHDGTLIDGQHRLMAIVRSGETVPMLVVRGLEEDSKAVVDTNLPRRLSDVGPDWLSVQAAAVLRAMYRSVHTDYSHRNPTHSEAITFAENYGDAIRFVTGNFSSRRGIRRAAVQGAVGRAYYHIESEELERFIQVLNTGVTCGSPGETSIIRLRDTLLAMLPYGGHAVSLVAYTKTERVLLAFRNNQLLEKIYSVTEEQFPLPGEALRIDG